MTTESKAIAIIPHSVPEVQSLAELIGRSALLPDALRGKTDDIIVSILAGAELGLSPMAAIRGVFVVQGKPVLAADTMVGLVLGSGLAEYFVQIESSHTSVTWETKRKGSPVAQRVTWTIEDAKKAGIHLKDNWRAYTRQMLAARAKAELARSAYSDVLAGVYDPDEIDIPVRAAHPSPSPSRSAEVIEDAEVVSESTGVADALLTKIAESTSVADLESLVPQLSALSNGRKAEARKLYGERKAALAQPAEGAP